VTRRRPSITALILGWSLLIVGCADAGAATNDPGPHAPNSSTPSPTEPATEIQDPFGCGLTVTPAVATVGDEVVVSRPPTDPAAICTTLAPGTVQILELRSVFWADAARQTTSVTVGADGSFEATMRVPADLRLDHAAVTAIPPAESDCTAAAAAAGTPDDCHFPSASFTARFAPEDLAPVRVVATDVTMPDLPVIDNADSFAVAGPGPTELTLVIFGSGCASRPASYRTDATDGRLAIVSEVIVPPGSDGCTAQLMPWTTVIEVPDAFLDHTSVTVDNLDTVLVE
jgi:hypothetical protein